MRHRRMLALAIALPCAAGLAQTVRAATAASGIGAFVTPSRNIVCLHIAASDSSPALLACGIRTGLKPAPRRRDCHGAGDYVHDRVTLQATGRTAVPTCAGDPGPFVGLHMRHSVLGYGRTWSGGGLRCTSTVNGLTCRNRSGHGFFLSRQRWRRF